MINKIKSVKKYIFPPSCPLCKDIVDVDDEYVCKFCRPLIPYLSAPFCFRCGKELKDEAAEYCKDCTDNERSYVKGFPAMNYVEPIKTALMDFKYHNKRYYSDFFAYEIIKTHGEEIKSLNFDAIVPIPVHSKKVKQRGYNQAKVLAECISDYINVPVDDELLLRNSNTLPQKFLSDEERLNNLKMAFSYSQKSVKYNKVLLVDDIYTTGATIEACTRILREAGIDDIYYASVCIGKGD